MSNSNVSKDVYVPIDCSLYDHLETFAIRDEPVSIKYRELGRDVELTDAVIETIITRNSEEFLKLLSGQEIRLDKLLLVDSLVFKSPKT